MKTISYTKAAKQIRALGFRVSKDDYGEIRVAWPGNESAAYYTDCQMDALETAKRMATELAPASDAEGEAVENGTHDAGEPFIADEHDDCGDIWNQDIPNTKLARILFCAGQTQLRRHA